MEIKLQSRIVAAICQFKAEHDIRYYLNGVYVEPLPTGGVVIVATNGHAMGIWRDPEGEIERNAILRISNKLQSACNSKGAKHLRLIDNRLTVVDKNGLEIHVQPNREKWEVEGKFPDWKKVVPKATDKPQLFDSLNVDYVTLVQRAIRIGTGGDRFAGICFRQESLDHGIAVTSGNRDAQDFVAIIMPVREGASPLPRWIEELRLEPVPIPSQPSDAAPVEIEEEATV